MNRQFIEPNFKHSNLNITATLAEYLGAPNDKYTLPLLKEELNKNYKNIVFICFDGMGIYPLKQNLPEDSFLRSHIVDTLVSTFPSTTTCATTSMFCNKYPLEHGWLGWYMYFPEIDKNVDIFPRRDSLTREPVDYDYPLFDNTDYFFYHTHSDYSINSVLAEYQKVKHPEYNHVVSTLDELTACIADILTKPNKQFVFAYLNEPDSTMHRNGVTSKKAKSLLENIDAQVEQLANSADDTLFIITADHGQIDIEGYIEFYNDEELNAMLKCVPFLDARTPAFIVKDGMKEVFAKKFTEKYGKDFVLYPSQELIDKGYFGDYGDKGYLLGDFIAIGTYTNKIFGAHKNVSNFKGQHTSLTDEMEVPLILISKR